MLLPFFTERQYGPGRVPDPPVRNDRDRPFIALDLFRSYSQSVTGGGLGSSQTLKEPQAGVN